jgi:hypothetical protein
MAADEATTADNEVMVTHNTTPAIENTQWNRPVDCGKKEASSISVFRRKSSSEDASIFGDKIGIFS